MMRLVRNSFYFLVTDDKSQLVQLSFLMLFVELTVIRWTGSNIFFLFFFTNFVLLASFLGMGIGFLRSKSSMNLFYFSPILLSALIFFCYYFSFEYQVQVIKETDNLNYHASYFKNNTFPICLTLPILFLTVTALMAMIADGVARTFQKFSPLQAYRLEVLGSLTGIILFSIFAFMHASPFYWGIIISVLYTSLLIKTWRLNNFFIMVLQLSALIIMVSIFAKESTVQNRFWSPYYKIDLKQYSGNRYVVNVNGLAQQIIESVEQRKRVKPFYFLPYQHNVQHQLNKVLVIGAGTGGDVAVALAQGANHVDAVEIDPVLYKIGKKLNPNQPYSDPRVRVFIDDGRAFLQRSTDKYDMIIFALTDSLMLIPGQSSLRLENYLYTLESISTVSKHLKPKGVFTIYNYYRSEWLVDRLSNTFTTVFKHPPCLDSFREKDYWATVLTISPTTSTLQCPTLWQPDNSKYSTPATDEHPFIYLKENGFSIIYIVTAFFILLTSLGALKKIGSSSSIKKYLDLFFMGAAFLLLETKNIINFALLFGTTWFVNALVFMGILLTVYLAIEVTNYTARLKPIFLYGTLLFTLLLAWLIPTSYLLSLPISLRFITATLLAFSPIFTANLIFSDRFREARYSTEAFGVNLIGAMLGGLLEYFSLIVGYRNLLVFIIVLYVMAIVLMRYGRSSIVNPNYVSNVLPSLVDSH